MSARALLEELRERDVRLRADGLLLHVDAPEEIDTDDLRATLREHKRTLIRHLERERRRLEEADRRGLVIKWSREPGYVSIHDPTTGEWHEVATSDCPPWVLEDARAHRRRRGDKPLGFLTVLVDGRFFCPLVFGIPFLSRPPIDLIPSLSCRRSSWTS